MSGILEQILSDVQAIRMTLQQMQQQIGTVQTAAVVQPAPVVIDPAAAQRAALEAQLAALNGGGAVGLAIQPQPTVAAVQNVSGDQLQALIMPHIDNVQIKEALGAAMRAAGINALPEAQPHQYGDLYARFQAVLAAHGVGPGATVAAQPVTTSII